VSLRSRVAATTVSLLVSSAVFAQAINPGGGGGGTFTWPGTAGNAVGGATTGGTMPYVNAYIAGGSAFTGWTPSFVYGAQMPVTSTSSNEALPTGTVPGSSILIYNLGPSGAAYKLGSSNAVTASTSNDYIAANNQACVNVPASVGSAGYIAALTLFTGVGATTTLNVSLGSGACNSTNSFQDFSVEIQGETAAFAHVIAGTDNSGNTNFLGATAAGTSSTKGILPVQGVSGGVPQPMSAAAGAFVSGSFLTGAFADGAIATIGTEADTAWTSGNGTEIAILKKIAGNTASFSGAVTIANGADVALGSTTDTAATTGTATLIALIKGLITQVQASIASGSNIIGATLTGFNVTPTDCSNTITTGGFPQAAITAQTTLHGFTIANIDTGHNDEVLWISFTGTAAALGTASWPLAAPTASTFAGMGSYTTPPGFGTNHAVSIIGATTGHLYSCSWW